MSKEKKKKFEKPQVKAVPLVVEEAVLSGCKSTNMSTGPGAAMNQCVNDLGMGMVADCSAMGS